MSMIDDGECRACGCTNEEACARCQQAKNEENVREMQNFDWDDNRNITCIIYDTTYKYDRMIKVEVISNKSHKRILKCQEGKRVWYQIWIPNLDMNCIERYFKGYNEVKRWWLPNLQLWYVFFYEKKGGKVRGVLGKDRTKDLIRSIL